jgi:hypothetical protein
MSEYFEGALSSDSDADSFVVFRMLPDYIVSI